jgi:hypothetical protein
MCPLATFLKGLFSHGNPVVDPGPAVPAPSADCEGLLLQAYEGDAWHFPGPQPAFNVKVAMRVATWFYTAAMVYADRSMTPELSTRLLDSSDVEKTDASAHYSADIVLRHLPALHELASGLAEGDPVLVSLREMAWRWPLSSVGIQKPLEWGEPDISILRSHSGIWRLFLDRVISFADSESLRDESTRSASRISLGLYPDLAIRLLPYWRDVEPELLELASFSR